MLAMAKESGDMKFRLLQARVPGDRVRQEERAAFANRLGVDEPCVLPFDLLADEISYNRVTDDVDAILVGGSGTYSVLDDAPWLYGFFDLLGSLANTGFPTFASCFGFQGLVVALGGEIRHDEDNAEVGSFDLTATSAAREDSVFSVLPDQFVAQEGHKDRAFALPSVLTNLASSDRCPFQAVRVGDSPVYATQFHPELTGQDNQLRFKRYFDMYSEAFGASQAQSMLDAFRPSPEANALLTRFKQLLIDQDRIRTKHD